MTLPMLLTWARIGLAPVFFIFYELAGAGSPFLLIGVWVCFVVIEVSDLLDGMFARMFKQETELGKVLDPFADSISRLSYFIALAGSAILPLWVLLILVYRDMTVSYIRVLTSRQNVLMPARVSGKLKAWIYAVAGLAGIVVFSLRRLAWLPGALADVQGIALVLFLLTAAVAVWSLADYTSFFLKNFGKTS
jgi:CDP-diacylglycerol--glycerol-3-phosphate 3-phosphatidyltransferase